MAKIGEKIGMGNKTVRFDVREIHYVESAVKWLDTKCNLDIKYYSFIILGNFDD